MARRKAEEMEDEVDKNDGRGPPTKKRKKKVISFVETEAQEDEEGDSDEYEVDGDEDGFVLDHDEAEEARELELAQRRRAEDRMNSSSQQRRGGAGHFATKIGDLERRYQDEEYNMEGGEYDLEGGDDDDDLEGVGEGGVEGDEGQYYDGVGGLEDDISRMLPNVGAWKLWKVPTIRPGVERETVIAILKRYAETPDVSKGSFQIGSAFASDNVKGAVYVEAISPLYIIDALRDIRTLVLVRNQIKMVPIKEMTDVFRVGGTGEDFPRRGEWARFARGQYAGDICLVSDVDESSQSVTVRVVPRIDLAYEAKAIQKENEGLAAGEGGGGSSRIPPPKTRPAAACITIGDLEARGIEPERVNDLAEAFKFRNYIIEETTGYLFKTTKISQLITGERVRATSLEIEEFIGNRDLNEIITDFQLSNKGVADAGFDVGQRVWIMKKDLMGICGVVKAKEDDRLVVQPEDSTLMPITIEPSFCVKRFDRGESVKVIAGQNEGDVGLITKLEVSKNIAHVLSTETHRQITVSLAHLAPIPNDTVTPVGLTKIDGYAIGDLVQLATSLEVGVITKILKTRRIEVLCKDGTISCDVSQLSGKKQLKLAHALDSQNNQFGTGESVEILEGPCAKKTGTVKYIWKDTVFIQIPSAVTSAGLVVSEANALRLMQGDRDKEGGAPGGGGAGGGDGLELGGHQRPPNGQSNFRGRGGFAGRGQISFRTQFNLMGNRVKIVGGQYKGMLGELRAIHGPDAVVLISALGKEVPLPRVQVTLCEGGGEGVQRFFRPSGGGGGGRGRGRGRGGGNF